VPQHAEKTDGSGQGGSDSTRFNEIKQRLRDNKRTRYAKRLLPNIGECFGKGTATFMILGICARALPFCDVAHGRPAPRTRASLSIWRRPSPRSRSITCHHQRRRDDLRDGGARSSHCIRALRGFRRARASKCWCPISAAGSRSRSHTRRDRPT